MPLLPGREDIGRNIRTEESAGKPHAQAVAIALRVADAAKGKSISEVQAESLRFGQNFADKLNGGKQ